MYVCMLSMKMDSFLHILTEKWNICECIKLKNTYTHRDIQICILCFTHLLILSVGVRRWRHPPRNGHHEGVSHGCQSRGNRSPCFVGSEHVRPRWCGKSYIDPPRRNGCWNETIRLSKHWSAHSRHGHYTFSLCARRACAR